MSEQNKFTYPDEYKGRVILTKWRTLGNMAEQFLQAITDGHGEIGIIYEKYNPNRLTLDRRVAILFEQEEDRTAFLLRHGDKFKNFTEAT